MSLADDIAREELARLSAQGLLRKLEPLRSRQGSVVELGGERLVNFSSNDYLGLAGDERIARALADGAAKWGAGAGASRLVCGDFEVQHELERELALFEGTEAAVLFNSGYAANCGLLPALAAPGDLIVSDALNHASIIDGCRLSRARVEVVPHSDLDAFDRALRAQARRKLVVVDAVFSMDGDRAPLVALRSLCDRHHALLLVDEAHATGVLAPSTMADVRMATLSKAFGVVGAFVAGPRSVCELLLNRARPLVFSTALPPALAVAALTSVRILRSAEGDARRARLQELIARAKQALGGGDSAIFPVVLGDRTMAAAAELRKRGFLVKGIRPPTVPTARLRIALSAAHTDEQLDSLLSALKEVA